MARKGKVISCSTALAVFLLSLFCFASAGMAEENRGGMLVIKIEKESVSIGSTAGKAEAALSGEIVYKVTQTPKGIGVALDSLGLVAPGIETKQGKSGSDLPPIIVPHSELYLAHKKVM